MGEILNPHKLEVFDDEEDYDVDKLNANFEKINEGIPVLLSVNSTYDVGNANFKSSRFTRLSVGDQGIIIASIHGSLKDGYSVTVPPNGQTPVYYNANIVPPNMRPKQQVGLVSGGIFSNEDKGDNLQCLLATDGKIGIRSTGSAFVRTSSGGLVFKWQIAYEWNGLEV